MQGQEKANYVREYNWRVEKFSPPGLQEGAEFGKLVDIDGRRAAVSTSAGVYILDLGQDDEWSVRAVLPSTGTTSLSLSGNFFSNW